MEIRRDVKYSRRLCATGKLLQQRLGVEVSVFDDADRERMLQSGDACHQTHLVLIAEIKYLVYSVSVLQKAHDWGGF